MEVVLETRGDNSEAGSQEVKFTEPAEVNNKAAAESKDPDLFRLKLKRNEDLGFRALVKEEKKKGKKKKEDPRSEPGMTSAGDNSGEGGASNDSDEITNLVEAFPEWNVGDASPFDSVELQKKKKSKPKYYTEATLEKQTQVLH